MGREAFKTSSGLLDNYDFWSSEAWFAKDSRFGGGRDPLLHIRGQAIIDGEVVNEEETLLYGCGQGWEINNGGQSVSHPSGKVNFSNASNLGKLLDALGALGDEPLDTMAEKGNPGDADVYVGIGVHIERKEYTFRDRETKQETKFEVPLPVAFLGFAETEEASAPAPAKASPAAKKAAPAKPAAPAAKKATAPAKKASAPVKKGATKPAPEPAEDDLRTAVVEYARIYDATEHAQFVDAVYDAEYFPRVEELQMDEELAAEVLDPDSSLWTEAHS